MKKMNRKGFTLVELVVVILIIAILATATFLGGATVIKQSRYAKVQTNLSNFATYAQDMMYSHPEIVGLAADTDDGDEGTTEYTAAEKALNLMNKDYLTQDFQLGTMKDSWEQEYVMTFANAKAANAGEHSYACIIISSNGVNTLPESGAAAAAVVAAKPASAEAAKASIGNVEDDLGVIMLMVDDAVSSATYGF